MKARHGQAIRLLLLGALPRLAVAGCIIVVLWLIFLWATAPVGGA